MNHDYAHCLDYSEDCPKDCFRGELVRDLMRLGNISHIVVSVVSWVHFKGTEECPKKEVTE